MSEIELTNTSTTNSPVPSNQDIDINESPRVSDIGSDLGTNLGTGLGTEGVVTDLDPGLGTDLGNEGVVTDLDAGLESDLGNEGVVTDLDAGLESDIGNEGAVTADVASPVNMGFDDNLGTGIDTDSVLVSDTSLAAPQLETNPSKKTSITIEITKDKLDELLTKISEETINYLNLLIKFLEKKTQLDTNDEKINKTIQELTQIKDNAIKILSENDITSNDFDPSSTAQKSQYAEMIMAALGLAVAVTGGTRSKTKSKKRVKKHKKTQNVEKKNYNHKSKKHIRKKGKTKGQIIKIKNDQVNKENN